VRVLQRGPSFLHPESQEIMRVLAMLASAVFFAATVSSESIHLTEDDFDAQALSKATSITFLSFVRFCANLWHNRVLFRLRTR